jgi:hypothetical protein
MCVQHTAYLRTGMSIAYDVRCTCMQTMYDVYEYIILHTTYMLLAYHIHVSGFLTNRPLSDPVLQIRNWDYVR